MVALLDTTAAIIRSGDIGARRGLAELVDAVGPEAAERILVSPDGDGTKRKTSIDNQLLRLVEDRGGVITHRQLPQHVAEILHEPVDAVRAAILAGEAAGRYVLVWANPKDDRRHTLRLAQ